VATNNRSPAVRDIDYHYINDFKKHYGLSGSSSSSNNCCRVVPVCHSSVPFSVKLVAQDNDERVQNVRIEKGCSINGSTLLNIGQNCWSNVLGADSIVRPFELSQINETNLNFSTFSAVVAKHDHLDITARAGSDGDDADSGFDTQVDTNSRSNTLPKSHAAHLFDFALVRSSSSSYNVNIPFPK
jgi:hypothetical protein